MIAKDDIDILCVVKDLVESRKLEEIGYNFRGEYNIPLKYSYSKNTEAYKVNLHLVEKDHGFISLNIKFRDYLRTHKDAAKEYAELKTKLLENPNAAEKRGLFSEYNLGKNLFIKDILRCAGFDDLIVNMVAHDKEWEEYHRIRKAEIFDGEPFEYNPNHPTITAEGHFHFVLYKGTEIVAVSHVEFWDEKTAILRPFATDRKHQGKGYGSFLLDFMEKYIKLNDKLIIKLHAYNVSLNFYKNRGYVDMDFEEESVFDNCTDLGKIL